MQTSGSRTVGSKSKASWLLALVEASPIHILQGLFPVFKIFLKFLILQHKWAGHIFVTKSPWLFRNSKKPKVNSKINKNVLIFRVFQIFSFIEMQKK